MAKNDSGRLWLDRNVVRYQSTKYGAWELPMSHVLVFGEYTNQNGPFLDDYFFVFVWGAGMWYEASFYAEGRDEFLKAFGEHLGASFQCNLANSTDFASNVLWPTDIAAQQLLEFSDKADRGIEGKISESIGLGSVQLSLSHSVLDKLASLDSDPI